ncbi:hypothetical protein EDD86DRAFT_212655 [Gorgonomyces haynaldii]|nr:hypothetical protein EDD86DRAFT_212655 [Gorgonomyces haynaldii]
MSIFSRWTFQLIMSSYSIFGFKAYKSSYLKLYFPFIISGTTIFFLFSAAHTALSNAPDDKWVKIVENVAEGTKRQALKAEAEKYLKEHH